MPLPLRGYIKLKTPPGALVTKVHPRALLSYYGRCYASEAGIRAMGVVLFSVTKELELFCLRSYFWSYPAEDYCIRHREPKREIVWILVLGSEAC